MAAAMSIVMAMAVFARGTPRLAGMQPHTRIGFQIAGVITLTHTHTDTNCQCRCRSVSMLEPIQADGCVADLLVELVVEFVRLPPSHRCGNGSGFIVMILQRWQTTQRSRSLGRPIVE